VAAARHWCFPFAAFAAAVTLSLPAAAQSTIRQPGNRVRYFFEAEPHFLLGPFDPPGVGADSGVGAGFRATLNILPSGFITPINDAVGIGFGLDWLHYESELGARGRCDRFVPGPAGTQVCVEASGSGPDSNYFLLPVVMQWNFFLHRNWSVFGEPGAMLYFENDELGFSPVVFYAGGRWHFAERVTLTLRLGYPTFSLGASFLL
jgi:hypothetical protein